MKREHASQTFLLCSRYRAEPWKPCGQSGGREVADREWGPCLAGESAAVHNKTVAITEPRCYLVSKHTLDMEPAIKKGDGGHNPPCFALRTAEKSVLVMCSFGSFGADCWGEPKHAQAETRMPLVHASSM